MAAGTRRTRAVGFITIGQSPRPDILGEFERTLGECRFVQAGALDDLSDGAVEELAPQGGEAVLVSRLRSGREVRLAHRHIEPRVQACLDRLAEEGVDLAVLLCTGDFPSLRPRGTLLRPERVVRHVAAAVLDGIRTRPREEMRLGVLVPDAAQVAGAEARWRALAPAVAAPASPYADTDGPEAAARALRAAGADLIVMDCMGYTRATQRAVSRASGVPAVLAAGAVALVIRELLEGRGDADRG